MALTAGAAGAARFEDGVAVFHLPKGGLMAAAAVNGQKINFEPLAGGDSSAGATSTTAGERPTTRPATRDSDDDEMQLRS